VQIGTTHQGSEQSGTEEGAARVELTSPHSTHWSDVPTSRGGATVLKVEGQMLRAERAENFFDPPLFGQWGD